MELLILKQPTAINASTRMKSGKKNYENCTEIRLGLSSTVYICSHTMLCVSLVAVIDLIFVLLQQAAQQFNLIFHTHTQAKNDVFIYENVTRRVCRMAGSNL